MAVVTLTDKAFSRVEDLLSQKKNFSLMLRAYVTSGGCSGFQYGFKFEEEIGADDAVIPIEKQRQDGSTAEITVLVDAASAEYLNGATIDFKQDLKGAYFIIANNPNAEASCSCGLSFGC